MNELNRLGLRIALITFGAVALVVVLWWGVQSLLQGTSTTPTADTPEEFLELLADVESRPDTDQDGLPDLFENIYRTDPNNPDTDGDGTRDLTELSEGRDPTVPGPDDFSTPPTGNEILNTDTLTGQYLATLPENAAREEVLDKERLEAFVELNKGELLPTLDDGTITPNESEGAAAIETYLNSISSAHNEDLVNVSNDDIEAALAAQLQLNPAQMDTLVASLQKNAEVLQAISPPAEVLQMHTTLVKATKALHTNVVTLRDIDNDFVAGLIASRNIDELGSIFQAIAEQVVELEIAYNIE